MILVGGVGAWWMGGGTIVRNVPSRWLEDGRLKVMVICDACVYRKISVWVPENGEWKPWLAIVLDGCQMGERGEVLGDNCR